MSIHRCFILDSFLNFARIRTAKNKASDKRFSVNMSSSCLRGRPLSWPTAASLGYCKGKDKNHNGKGFCRKICKNLSLVTICSQL